MEAVGKAFPEVFGRKKYLAGSCGGNRSFDRKRSDAMRSFQPRGGGMSKTSASDNPEGSSEAKEGGLGFGPLKGGNADA